MEQPRVSGQYVQAFLQSAGEVSPVFERKALGYLEDHGLEDIDSEDWYPMEKFAPALQAIKEDVGEMTLKRAGIVQVEVTESITSMESPEASVAAANEVLRQVYRNYSPEAVGEFRYEEVGDGDHRISMAGAWPYPAQFTKGIMLGLLRETLGVEVADSEPTSKEPEESCAFVFET
jgi:hypothetical protein